MPKKKLPEEGAKREQNPNVLGLKSEVLEQPITETLELNYMPYAMSVIVSRAIPEIDGFKPSHRKLLFTMYQMHLLGGARTKSANVVGQTMKLNPHGDAAIYDTMVRLSRGYGALLHPFVDSKGNFGKVYSRDMACAASRYTEVRLDEICGELFRDIDQDTVDFTDNYDGTLREPSLLPTTFPNVLVSANTGIAGGMASSLGGFNLAEVCETTVAYLKNRTTTCSPPSKRRTFPPAGSFYTMRPRWPSSTAPDGLRQGALPVAVSEKRKSHRNLRDPLLHHGRGHYGQGGRAHQSGQTERDLRHAGRDRPFRFKTHHRFKARHRPGRAHEPALPPHAPPGVRRLQL
jgi:hypothetical protein